MACPPRLLESQQRCTRTQRGAPLPPAGHTSRSLGRRSGKSVRIWAATSPCNPRGRKILARVTPVNFSVGLLFEDFKSEALPNFHPGGAQDGTDGFRRTPLTANHFAEVFGMHAQLEDGDLLAVHRSHLNLFGMVYQSSCNCFDQVLH